MRAAIRTLGRTVRRIPEFVSALELYMARFVRGAYPENEQDRQRGQH